MSVLKRFKLIFGAKANKLADKAENPAEALDYSYEQMLDKEREAKSALVGVATAKKTHEAKLRHGEAQIAKLDDQVRQALQQGNDDLAARILTAKAEAESSLSGVRQAYESVAAQQEKLEGTIRTLRKTIEGFATHKETLKANYAAADAANKINEAVTGIGEGAADIGLMIQRAESKTAELQARSAGMDELMESGALRDFGSTPGDEFAAELTKGGSPAIQNQLAAMKAEMGILPAPAAPAELGTGSTEKTEEVR